MIQKYSSLKIANEAKQLPANVVKAFIEVGDLQRINPEEAMRKVQLAAGGVLNPVVEHAGDLIHRMTNMLRWQDDSFYRTGWEYISDKVKKVLNYLTNNGFEREILKNLESNAEYIGKDPHKYKADVFTLLKKYGEEHSKLPVYNRAQWLARQICINIGNEDWASAISFLKELESKCKSPEEWDNFAKEYKLTDSGLPQEYPWR